MTNVITATPLVKLTIEELHQTFGGTDDQTTVLDGGLIVEDYDL